MFEVFKLKRELQSEKSWERSVAAEALGRLGNKSAVKPLIRALGDKNKNVRDDAAKALGQLGDLRAEEPLIQVLEHDSSSYDAARVLGELGDARAIEPLIRTFGNWRDRNDRTTSEAVVKFGRYAVEPLIKALDYREVRTEECYLRKVTEALAKIGDPRAVEPLITILRDRAHNFISEALGKLGNPQAVEPLLQALADRVLSDRAAAATALAKLGEPKWCDLIKGDYNDWSRVGASGDPYAVVLLINALGNGCVGAADALGELGDVRAVEPLIQALGHEDGRVQSGAATALGKLGDARAIEPLIQVLGAQHDYARRAAGEALAKLGEPKWCNIISGDCTDWPKLGTCGDARVAETLIQTFSDGYDKDRAAIAGALGQLGDPRAVEPLVLALGNNNHNVRRTAAEALAKLGEPKWSNIIDGSDDDWGRLCSCDDPRGVELTISGLIRGDLSAAAIALGNFGDERAVEPLIRALEKKEKGSFWGTKNSRLVVKRAAAAALVNLARSHPNWIGKRWEDVKKLVSARHNDYISVDNSSDCNQSPDSHVDDGIGLSFPPPPSGLDF